MLWDPFLYCINDSIQGKSETDNRVFVLPSKVSINIHTPNLYIVIIPYEFFQLHFPDSSF